MIYTLEKRHEFGGGTMTTHWEVRSYTHVTKIGVYAGGKTLKSGTKPQCEKFAGSKGLSRKRDKTREVLTVTNFEKLAQSPAGLGAFLRGLPILEGPWDDEFHKRYCRKCSSTDCTYCPHEKFRNNPEWWLNLKAR